MASNDNYPPPPAQPYYAQNQPQYVPAQNNEWQPPPPQQPYPMYQPPPPQQPYPMYQPPPPPQQQQHPPPPQRPVYPNYVAPSPPRQSWFRRNQQNKAQSNSLAAASMIFVTGGMEIGFGSFTPRWATAMLDIQDQTNMLTSWNAGVIIGSFVSAIIVSKIEKKFIYYFAGVLSLIAGIIYTADNSITGFVAARYLNGIAFGLSLLAAIIAGGEVAVKSNRGLVLSQESMLVASGMTITAIYQNLWEYNSAFSPDQMHGVLIIVFAAMALGFNSLTIESPIYFLKRDDESSALLAMQSLEKCSSPTSAIYEALDGHKRLIEEDNTKSLIAKLSEGVLPLAKLIFYRATYAMSMSWPMHLTFFWANYVGLQATYGIYVNALIRWFGTMIAGLMLVDRVGRKAVTLVSALVAIVLLYTIGGVWGNMNVYNLTDIWTQMASLIMTYQFFAGVMAPASTIYLSEAFYPSLKPYFIFCSIFFENLIQIICFVAILQNPLQIDTFFYAFGAIQIIVFVILASLPETKNLTLLECIEKIRRPINWFK